MPRTQQTPAPQRPSFADKLTDVEIQRYYYVADLPPTLARAHAKDCDRLQEESAVRLDNALRHAIKNKIAALKHGS